MTGRVAALVRAGAGLPLVRRLDVVERTLVGGTAGTIVLNVAQMLLNFCVILFLSRLLGAEGFGAYAYAFAWASLLAVPSVLGLTPLVVRNVAAYRVRAEWGLLRGMLARTNQAVLVSSALLVLVGGIVALVVNGSNSELLYPLLVGLLLVPVVALTSIRQAAMQGLGRVVVGRMPETLVAPAIFLILIGAGYVVASHSFSATWVMALQVTASFAALAVGAVLLWRALPHDVKTERPEHAMREWIRSAVPFLLFSLIQALNVQIEVILLGAIKGPTEAGLFSVAARVSGVVAFVVLAVGYPLSPVIARLHAAGDTALLRRTVRRTAPAVFLVTLPLAIGVMVFARPLLELFGSEFEAGVTALRILVVGQAIYAAICLGGTVLMMTGNESLLVRALAAGTVTNIILNALLIPPYGLNGAALAGVISFALMNVSLVYLARRRAGVPSTAFGI